MRISAARFNDVRGTRTQFGYVCEAQMLAKGEEKVTRTRDLLMGPSSAEEAGSMIRSAAQLSAGALAVILILVGCTGGGSPTIGLPTTAPQATIQATNATPVPTIQATNATPAPSASIRVTPDPAANVGRIAFAVRAPDGINLFSVLPDGTDMRQLTTNPGNHLCASYSPDASQIAYCGDASGNFEVWTMASDGTGQAQLTDLGGRALFPKFSPNGTKIVFAGIEGDDPNTEVYVVASTTGGGLVALTSCAGLASGCANDYPAWSPDGKHIVYIHSDDTVNEVGVNEQVWVMNVDGSNQHQLTTDSPPKDQLPNWSPDGTSIVYTSGALSNEGIWVMKSDGSGQHQLSGCGAGAESPCPEGSDFGPVWSPDGVQIAFLRSFEDVGANDRPVYVMNADGSEQHRVTEETILAAVPTWR